MRKTIVTAENVNSIIRHYTEKIESVKKELHEKYKDREQAIWGGLRILEFTYKEEIKILEEKNKLLINENDRLKK
jgi:hypothetical protein